MGRLHSVEYGGPDGIPEGPAGHPDARRSRLPAHDGSILVGRESSIRALEHASRNDKLVFVATQRDAAVEGPSAANLYTSDTSMPPLRDNDCEKVVDTISADLRIDVQEKQQLLELISCEERVAQLAEILTRELRVRRPPREQVDPGELARSELAQLLKSSRFSGPLFDRAVEVVARPLPTYDERMFAFRGLSRTGKKRVRQLLERHAFAVDVADEALRVLIRLMEDEEHDRMRQTLAGLLSLIREIGVHVAAEWAMFGLNAERSN